MGNRTDGGSGSELELNWGSREPRPQGDGPDAAPPAEEAEAPALAGKGPPGDPRYMSMELRFSLEAVLKSPMLHMRQFRETVEILIGWEGKNQYSISGEDGRNSVFVGETGEGWASGLMRNFWPFYRTRLECMTPTGMMALAVEIPWSLFFARAEVLAWDGRLLGTIEQRWTVFQRCLDIVSPTGVVLASVVGPFFKPWTFRVLKRDEEVAVIRKRWSGMLQESFTDADNFTVEFQPSCTDPRLRQLLMSTALFVDLLYFDNRKGRSSGLSLPD
ncbi:scramblase family protein-like protein [Myxococcus stipitatus DSM 14675]|uniref:Scramblase family protein-like protein n=1 Tax=Myxococcus stipitatus (strain DSM 14675 / JCM 12634 / Mx s8) TaxID=1278073 RepID=L7UJF3_MYXSD|nr:phospholipid scramblase-related protein [Myxococcus stipitatus]AGC48138.1 scramblase family protein-like protein [Myxococcus stipitatus DSM 14675]